MCFNFHEIEIPIHINEKIESNEVADISHGNNHLKRKHVKVMIGSPKEY